MSNGIEIGLVLATVKISARYKLQKFQDYFDQNSLSIRIDSLICLQ